MAHSPGRIFAAVALASAAALSAQPSSRAGNDLFAKYPVKVAFHGHPAAPVLTDPDARGFRTRIREGAARGPVFADHYAIAGWGCGTSCICFAIIDSISGRVYMFPNTVSAPGYVGDMLTYHRNSRAIHIVGYLNEENLADRWYGWDGKTLNLVQERPTDLGDHAPAPQSQ